MATHKPVIDIPCKFCSHARSKHNSLIDHSLDNLNLTDYCVSCYNSLGKESCFHGFEADNLKYLELEYERKEQR